MQERAKVRIEHTEEGLDGTWVTTAHEHGTEGAADIPENLSAVLCEFPRATSLVADTLREVLWHSFHKDDLPPHLRMMRDAASLDDQWWDRFDANNKLKDHKDATKANNALKRAIPETSLLFAVTLPGDPPSLMQIEVASAEDIVRVRGVKAESIRLVSLVTAKNCQLFLAVWPTVVETLL